MSFARTVSPLFFCLLLAACGGSSRTQGPDESRHYVEAGYGRSALDPIRVGGLSGESGPADERAYLNRLRGPNGELVAFERVQSCCQFETDNSPFGAGLLDVYSVQHEGLGEPVLLYLNMYDPAESELRAPEGFYVVR